MRTVGIVLLSFNRYKFTAIAREYYEPVKLILLIKRAEYYVYIL